MFGKFPSALMEDLIQEARQKDVAIEINSSYLGEDLAEFLRLCERIDPLVSVGSDAHRLHELGRCGGLVREWFKW